MVSMVVLLLRWVPIRHQSDLKQFSLLLLITLEQRKSAVRRAGIDLDEAEDMVSQMEVEIQGMPQSIRPQYVGRVKTSKGELSRWRGVAVRICF